MNRAQKLSQGSLISSMDIKYNTATIEIIKVKSEPTYKPYVCGDNRGLFLKLATTVRNLHCLCCSIMFPSKSGPKFGIAPIRSKFSPLTAL